MTEPHAGESLAARLQAGPLPIAEAVRIAAAVAAALEPGHRAGRIHHNLKPANVLLDAGGIKLLESGAAIPPDVATVIHAATAAGGHHADDAMPAERLQYLSPEQIEGPAVDARTDVFGLGVLLYEMVTGKKAFDANSPGGIVTAILFLDPPVISMHLSNAPRGLENVIRRALEKSPDRRFPSVADFRQHLDRAGHEAPLPARPSAHAGQTPVTQGSRSSLLLMIGAAVLAVLLWLFLR